MRVKHALLAGLAALSALAVLGVTASRSPAPSALPRSADPVRVEIRRPREDLILTREKDGLWYVLRAADLADAQAVESLLAGLRALEFGPPLGAAESATASGLGPADSARVRVLDAAGNALFDGYFGRRVFGRSAYFRARENDAVRLASGLDPELLVRPSSRWREPRLLPGGCPSGLAIAGRRAWRRVPDDAARALCALRAVRWAEEGPSDEGAFERPLFTARTPEGAAFTVGDRRGAERLARVDGRAALIRIAADPVEAVAADLVGSKP